MLLRWNADTLVSVPVSSVLILLYVPVTSSSSHSSSLLGNLFITVHTRLPPFLSDDDDDDQQLGASLVHSPDACCPSLGASPALRS